MGKLVKLYLVEAGDRKDGQSKPFHAIGWGERVSGFVSYHKTSSADGFTHALEKLGGRKEEKKKVIQLPPRLRF